MRYKITAIATELEIGEVNGNDGNRGIKGCLPVREGWVALRMAGGLVWIGVWKRRWLYEAQELEIWFREVDGY